MFLIGRSLQRRAMRNGVLVALAYGSAIMGINLGDESKLSQEQLFGLLAMAFASYPAGIVLVKISNLLTRGNIVTAAGGYLHLTSHFKQARKAEHLSLLWDRVFRHESAFDKSVDDIVMSKTRLAATKLAIHEWMDELPRGVRAAMQLDDDGNERRLVERILSSYPHDPQVEATKELFVLTGSYALGTPLPQALQERRIGFDLSPLEDWYEKGLFTFEEFPAKAFLRDPWIRQIRALLRPKWLHLIDTWLAIEPTPSFWYVFTTRKLGVLTGKAISELNRLANEPSAIGYFDTQHFLWPSADLDDDVLSHFGERGEALLALLRTRREGNLRELFSDDPEVARHHIFRMFLPDYKGILRLRLSFDVEYAGGADHFSPAAELAEMEAHYGAEILSARTLRKLTGRAKKSLVLADDLLDRLAFDTGTRAARAVRIAYHCNYQNLRGIWNESARDVTPDLQAIVDGVASGERLFRASLVRIRTYEVLAILQMATYTELVDRLMHGRPTVG